MAFFSSHKTFKLASVVIHFAKYEILLPSLKKKKIVWKCVNYNYEFYSGSCPKLNLFYEWFPSAQKRLQELRVRILS